MYQFLILYSSLEQCFVRQLVSRLSGIYRLFLGGCCNALSSSSRLHPICLCPWAFTRSSARQQSRSGKAPQASWSGRWWDTPGMPAEHMNKAVHFPAVLSTEASEGLPVLCKLHTDPAAWRPSLSTRDWTICEHKIYWFVCEHVYILHIRELSGCYFFFKCHSQCSSLTREPHATKPRHEAILVSFLFTLDSDVT